MDEIFIFLNIIAKDSCIYSFNVFLTSDPLSTNY